VSTDPDTPPPVEKRYAARLGRSGLATLHLRPKHPNTLHLAVGQAVRLIVGAQDAEQLTRIITSALDGGAAAGELSNGTGFYLEDRGTRLRWSQRAHAETGYGLVPTERIYRLSVGSPLRRWIWRSELHALRAVLTGYLADQPAPESRPPGSEPRRS
jgi:hypothetical protein